MVEQHDECLECLAKLKNRSELYRTLADNNKPNNNVIKSLQRLSSSASNNRLKTCLQFLIIKVNEKSIATPKQNKPTLNGSASPKSTVHQTDITKDASPDFPIKQTSLNSTRTSTALHTATTAISTGKISKKHKLRHQQPKQNHQKMNQLASPPQDQVSSTQDQVGPNQDEHDCQTSPLMLTESHIDEPNHEHLIDQLTTTTASESSKSIDEDGLNSAMTSTTTTYIKLDEEAPFQDHHEQKFVAVQINQSSPTVNSCNSSLTPVSTSTTTTSVTTATLTSTATTSTSPLHIVDYEASEELDNLAKPNIDSFIEKSINLKDHIKLAGLNTNGSGGNISSYNSSSGSSSSGSTPSNTNTDSDNNMRKLQGPREQHGVAKRRRIQNSLGSDHDTSSLASWSLASYNAGSPPSPISSASSTSSFSSSESLDSDSSSYNSASSTCSSSFSREQTSPSVTPSSTPPLSMPEFNTELKGPRLKLSEEKIRRIKKKPVLIDDYFYTTEQMDNYYRKPANSIVTLTSVRFSPGQPNSAQIPDHSSSSSNSSSCFSSGFGSCLGLSTSNMVMHSFQAPPTFVNNLKSSHLPKVKSQDSSPSPNVPPVSQAKVELINCAICGIKEKPPRISKIYGQNSCLLCTEFFAEFLKTPKQYYCAHDGDCLMTFDSRCQACWIKICLQKFDVDEESRKIGQKYSPKLLLSPNVSLITIDTSVPD